MIKKYYLLIAFLFIVSLSNAQTTFDQALSQFGGQNALGARISFIPVKCGADNNGQFIEYNKNGTISRLVQRAPNATIFLVKGEIYKKWIEKGAEKGFLGYPQNNESVTPDGIGRFNHFDGGSVYYSPQTGTHEVHGMLRAQWERLGWERTIGYPVTDEIAYNNGWYASEFQRGLITWSAANKYITLLNDDFTKWKASGGQNGSLGFPISRATDGTIVYQKSVKKAPAIMSAQTVLNNNNNVERFVLGKRYEKITPYGKVKIYDKGAPDAEVSNNSMPYNQKTSNEGETICDFYSVDITNATTDQMILDYSKTIYPGLIYSLDDLTNGIVEPLKGMTYKPYKILVENIGKGLSFNGGQDVSVNGNGGYSGISNAYAQLVTRVPITNQVGFGVLNKSETESAKEMQTKFASSFGGWGVEAKASYDNIKSSKETTVYAEYYQPFFNLKIDNLSFQGNINDLVTNPPTNKSTKNWVYVSKIILGRRAFFTAQSKYSLDVTKAAIEARYKSITVSAGGNMKYTDSLVNSSLTVKGIQMGGTSTAPLQSIDDFSNFVKSSKDFNTQNMPAILGYELTFVDGGKPAKVVTTSTITVPKCRPKNPVVEITLNYIETTGLGIGGNIILTAQKYNAQTGQLNGAQQQETVWQYGGMYKDDKVGLGQVPTNIDKNKLPSSEKAPAKVITMQFTDEDIQKGAYINFFYGLKNEMSGNFMNLSAFGTPYHYGSTSGQDYKIKVSDLLKRPDFFYDRLQAGGYFINVGWTVKFLDK